MFSTGTKNLDTSYLNYHKDGLGDIVIGLFILLAGLFIKIELVWMVAIFAPIFTTSIRPVRLKFLRSRLGEPDPSPEDAARVQRMTYVGVIFLGVLALAGVGMFIGVGFMSGAVNEFLKSFVLVILGAVFASAWVFAGTILKTQRFYVYAGITFLLCAVSQFSSLSFWMALILVGTAISVIGIGTLIRFVQEHPVISQ